MPRRLTPTEKKRASTAWDAIVRASETICDMVYTPDLIRELVGDHGMSVDSAVQAIRDLLSLELCEMHFDQALRPIPARDEPFVFPAPATTNENSASPYPLPYLRRMTAPDQEPCGLDHCGAKAKDFKQPAVLYDGWAEDWEKIGKSNKWVLRGMKAVDVDLEYYDIIAVNSSGGKDSQAMLDAVYRECRRRGIEDRIHVYFADLERAEWPGTGSLARRQAMYYGAAFDAVTRPQGDLPALIEERGEWMSFGPRFCTSRCKTGQINRLFTRDAKDVRDAIKAEGGDPRRARILNCLGIRAQEGDARSRKFPFQPDSEEHGSNATARKVDVWYPIFQWTNEDVWETIARSGVPHHWAYDVLEPRLSCPFCFYADRSALLLAGTYNPEMLDLYVGIEQKFRAAKRPRPQFKADLSLEELRDAIEGGEKPSGIIEIET